MNGDLVVHSEPDVGTLLMSTITLLGRRGLDLALDDYSRKVLLLKYKAQEELESNARLGREIKQGKIPSSPHVAAFLAFLNDGLARPLLSHLRKSAIHLVALSNAANLSVPGAGKTAVVLSVYEYLRNAGILSALFVVGPRSCFKPWVTEFRLTLGRQPTVSVLAGGDISQRRHNYYPVQGSGSELYLTTYHTLSRDREHVENLLLGAANRTFFVIDEAHYMKQEDGVWANAVLTTSRHALKRCVLTGTPFPRTYADGINEFAALFPDGELFSTDVRAKIRRSSDENDHESARHQLENAIDGLYYRVRKRDLELSDPVFLPPTLVPMNPIERELYDSIETRIAQLEDKIGDNDFETILKLRKGGLVRKRQATSYAKLLLSSIDNIHEDVIDPLEDHLTHKILSYDEREVPAKLEQLIENVRRLQVASLKVVIWTNFVGTLFRIKDAFDALDWDNRVVYGGTPTDDAQDGDSREEIIEEFKDRNSNLDILIANPAACAESISLHKTCHNAIYYDLSYNCAEYLQSLDRIHRVGGSETRKPCYEFLQYADTFEYQILENLLEKAHRMAIVIDKDFPLASSELAHLGFGDDFVHP